MMTLFFISSLFLYVVASNNCSYNKPLKNSFLPSYFHLPITKNKLPYEDCKVRERKFIIQSKEIPKDHSFHAYIIPLPFLSKISNEEKKSNNNKKRRSLEEDGDSQFRYFRMYIGENYIPTEEKYDSMTSTTTSFGVISHKNSNNDSSLMYILVKLMNDDHEDLYSTLWIAGFYFSPQIIANLVMIPIISICLVCYSIILLNCFLFLSYKALCHCCCNSYIRRVSPFKKTTVLKEPLLVADKTLSTEEEVYYDEEYYGEGEGDYYDEQQQEQHHEEVGEFFYEEQNGEVVEDVEEEIDDSTNQKNDVNQPFRGSFDE